MNDYRILVVDDEEDLCEILKFNLENEGYEVDTANSAEEALKMDISSYHLLLLDVMMGEISGFKMANILKKDKKTAHVPIIFITAKDTENDTVTGFNLGADDYISKPFSLREVIARVKAVLRRTVTPETEKAPEQITYQTLVIDITKKKVSIDGEEVALTKKNSKSYSCYYRTKDGYFRARTSLPAYGAMKYTYSTVRSMSTSPVCVKRSAYMASGSSPAWDTDIALKQNEIMK